MFDVTQAIAAAPQIKGAIQSVGGPKAVVWRLLGFGENEMRAGVPGWAWFLIGAAAGGFAVWFNRARIEHWAERIEDRR